MGSNEPHVSSRRIQNDIPTYAIATARKFSKHIFTRWKYDVVSVEPGPNRNGGVRHGIMRCRRRWCFRFPVLNGNSIASSNVGHGRVWRCFFSVFCTRLKTRDWIKVIPPRRLGLLYDFYTEFGLVGRRNAVDSRFEIRRNPLQTETRFGRSLIRFDGAIRKFVIA